MNIYLVSQHHHKVSSKFTDKLRRNLQIEHVQIISPKRNERIIFYNAIIHPFYRMPSLSRNLSQNPVCGLEDVLT